MGIAVTSRIKWRIRIKRYQRGYSGESGIKDIAERGGISGYSGESGISDIRVSVGNQEFPATVETGSLVVIPATPGISGYSGYSGYSGISGFSGESGISGWSGESEYLDFLGGWICRIS